MRRALLWALGLLAAAPGWAAAEPDTLRGLVDAAAGRAGVAPDLVAAIIWVESRGWPWTLNVRGAPYWTWTRQDAERLLREIREDDVDVGLMQVNWRTWGPALRRVGLRREDLLDPWVSLLVGSQILRRMMEDEPGWGGVGRYHSATPWRKSRYAWAVARTWQALAPVFRKESTDQGACGAHRSLTR